ncbi:MAG: hypothetical protein V1903_03860 [Bacteroidota bacterium]
MKPDRSNYEIWLIDWLDGNLDEARTEQLMLFLEENPDLKEEADSLSLAKLDPDMNISVMKSGLKRNPADLPVSQVEYLSIAFLENDLSAAQAGELKESISLNSGNRKLFDAIQKTKLQPKDYSFENKKGLLRETRAQKMSRLVVRSLSAAAAVTILMVTFFSLARRQETGSEIIAVSRTDTFYINPGQAIIIKEELAFNVLPVNQIRADETLPEATIADEQIPVSAADDTISFPDINPDMFITAIPVLTYPGFTSERTINSLVSLNIDTREPAYYDPDRGRIKRFIASNFRTKILKNKMYNDAPLHTYEIAEAGIEGLNNLLGWEMALVKTSDDEGELQSLYFSSRVLKFNAPVKKPDPSM